MTSAQAREKLKQEILQAVGEQREREAELRKQNMSAEERRLQEEKKRIEAQQTRDMMLADAHGKLTLGRPEEAIEVVEKILKPSQPREVIDPETNEIRLEELPPPEIPDPEESLILEVKALASNQLGDRAKAIKVYEEVVRLDPTRRASRKNLGLLLFQEQRFQEAIDVWGLEIDDGYYDPDILYQYAQAHYKVYSDATPDERDPGHLEEARVAMQIALLRNARNLHARRWVAFLEYESGRYDEAARHYEAIRQATPYDHQNLQRLADAYVKSGEYDKATDTYEMLLRVAEVPGSTKRRICRSLGDLYANKDHLGQAASWYSRSYDGDAANAEPRERLRVARFFVDAGDYEQAVAWAEAVPEDDDLYFDAQSILAAIHQTLGQDDAALESFLRIQKKRPTDGRAFLVAGDIYLDKKDLEAAYRSYTVASVLPQSKADGFAGLAEVAYAERDLEEAIEQYGKALTVRPDDKGFAEALQQIREELDIERQLAKAGE